MSAAKKKTRDARGHTRLISKGEVLDRTGISYPTIWAWMREEKFPRSRSVGGKAMWVEAEIEGWILSRPLRALKGDKAAA
jgi:predicted DNA-binding transcriptional regulator AlpA